METNNPKYKLNDPACVIGPDRVEQLVDETVEYMASLFPITDEQKAQFRAWMLASAKGLDAQIEAEMAKHGIKKK